MNTTFFNRSLNPWLMLLYMITITAIAATGFQLLSGFFQFIEIFIENTGRQLVSYFSNITMHN